MSAIPSIQLNNGVAIPQLGYGVFKIRPSDTRAATLAALDLGYRHIDTAEMYGNERGVGQAVREAADRVGIARSDVFVTSKLNNGYHAYDAALAAFDATMSELGLEYLDLFLIHWPMPNLGDYVETWRAMEAMYEGGRVRAIGVSNFQPEHLRRLFDETSVVPAVNQIEVHPYLVQHEARAFDAAHDIATEAWSPIARGRVNRDPVIGSIASRLDRSPAQVTLRWHIQRGDIVFPKSIHPERMAQNLAIFDFALSDEDMATITGLDRGERTGPHPDEFHWIP